MKEVKNMYEIIINGKTQAVVDNRVQATAIYNFYRTEKMLFNIKSLVLLDVNNNRCIEG